MDGTQDWVFLTGTAFTAAIFEVVFFCVTGFNTDFIFLGTEADTGSPLAFNGAWHLQGPRISSVG